MGILETVVLGKQAAGNKPEPERGPLGELWAAGKQGMIEAGKTFSQSAKTVGFLPETSDAVTSYFEGLEEKYAKDLEPTKKGEFWRSINQGLTSTVQSFTAGAPGAIVGGLVGGPVGAVLGFALGGGGLFALSQFESVLKDAEKAGLSREDSEVQKEAFIQALAEGGFEAASDVVASLTFGLLKLPAKIGLAAVKPSLKEAEKTLLKSTGSFLGKLAVVAAAETSTEMATSYTEAESSRRLGIPGTPTGKEAAIQTIGPVLFQSLFMAGAGAGLSRIKGKPVQSGEMGDREAEVKKIVTEARQPVTPPVDEGLIERVPVEEVTKQEPPTAGAGAVPIQPTPAPAPTIPEEPAAPAVEIPTLPSLDEYWGTTPKAMDDKLNAMDKFHKDIMAKAKTEADRIRNEIKGLKGKEDEASLAKKAELQGLLGTVEKQATNIQTAIKTGEQTLYDQIKQQVVSQIEGTPEQKQAAWEAFRTEWKNQPDKPLGEILKGMVTVPVKEVKPSEERKAKAETVLKDRRDLLSDGWKLEVGKTRTKEGHTSEAEVDWNGRRLVFADKKHLDNPEIVNHEIAHVVIEELAGKDDLFSKYAELKSDEWKSKGYEPEWVVKNQFHREEIAMDYGNYLNDPNSVSPELRDLFGKSLPGQVESFQEKLKTGAKALTGAKKKGKAKAEPATREKPIENAPINIQKFALSKALKHAKARGIDFATLGPGSVVQIRPGDLAKYKEGTFVRISEEGFKSYNERRAKRAKQAAGAASAPPKTLRQFIKSKGGLATDDPVYGKLIKDRLMTKKGWPVGSFSTIAKGAKTLSKMWESVKAENFDFVTPEMEEADLIELLRTNPPINKGVKEKAETQVKEEGKKEDEAKTLEAGILLFGSKTAEEARKSLEGKYGKDWYYSEEFDRDFRAAEAKEAAVENDEIARLRAEARPKLEAYLRREDYKEGDIPGLIDQIFADEAKFNETLAEIEAYEKQAKGGEEGEVPFEEAPAEKKPVKALTGAKGKKEPPEPKLPEGLEGLAGEKGLKQVTPEAGDTVWTTSSETGKLEAIRYGGKTGNKYDQYEYEKWIWLTGPEKGRDDTAYGRTFWIPEEPKPEVKEEKPAEDITIRDGGSYIRIANLEGNVWSIEDVEVPEAERQKGIGSSLYEKAIAEVHKRGGKLYTGSATWLGTKVRESFERQGRLGQEEEIAGGPRREFLVKGGEEKKVEPEPSELQELRKQVEVLKNEPMRIVSKMFKNPAAIAQMTGEERKEAQKKFDRMVAVEARRLQPEIDKLQAKIDEILAKPEPETQRLFGEEVTGKPIWQMTKAENWNAFLESRPKQPWNGEPSLPSRESNLKALIKKVDETHKAAVKQALEEGKPVPDNVLDDYPDLKPPEPPQGGLFGKPGKKKTLFDMADELDDLIEEEPTRREMAEITPEDRNFQAVSTALDRQLQEAQDEGKTLEQFIKERGDKISPRVAPYFERWANEKTGQNAGNIQPVVGRVEAPPGGAGKAAAGGVVGGGIRPGLRVAGREFLPRPGNHVDVGRYPILGGDQRYAANLIVQAQKDGKRGFLYASGVGTGKTIGQLVAGNIIAEQTGGKVLFITQNKAIVDTRFIPDAKEKLGIDLTDKTRFELGTYDDLRTGKVGQGEYEAAFFDESHNLANVESLRTIASEKVPAKIKVYSSATPGDQPVKFATFMAKITGVPEETIHKALGFEVQWYEDPHTKEQKPRTVLLQGMSWKKVMDNVVDYRNQAIKKGTFYRAELPFWGNLDVKRSYLSTDMEEEQNQINTYWSERMQYARNKMRVAGEWAQELRRWIELKKVGPIYDAAMKALADGKKVVVVAEGVNATGIKGLGIEKGDYKAFIQAFEDRLKREGTIKDWSKIYGSRDKTKEVDRFQNGQTDLAIMTPQSGGAGIDLDDIVGTKPRAVFVANVNYSADVFEQVTGRFSRKNTKTPTDINFYFFEGARGDIRSWQIIDRKVQTVKAIQRGIADLDKAIGMTVIDESGQPKSLVFINQDGQRAEPFTEKPVRSRIEQIREELETDKIPAISEIEHRLVSLMEGNKMPMLTLDKAKAESLSNLLKLSLVTQQMKAGKKPISAYIETPAKGVYEFRRPYGWFVYREGGIVEIKDRREMAETGKEQRTPDAMLQLIASLQPAGQPRALVSITELRNNAITWPYDEFDRTLLQLSRDGKVALHHHDFAASLSEAERKMLLSIEDAMARWGGRTYFVGVVPKVEVKPVAKPQVTVIKMSDHPELKKAIDVGGGVMVTTGMKDPAADEKVREIVNVNKDLFAAFGKIPKKLKELLIKSGWKDIPDIFVTADPNVRGYVPDDQRKDTPAFLSMTGKGLNFEERVKRMGEARARAHGVIGAIIHEYAEYLTRNSPTIHGTEFQRVYDSIHDSIDPEDQAALTNEIAENFYGKYLTRIQSVGENLSKVAKTGSKLFGRDFPGRGWRREMAEAASANRGNREQALIRGGTFDSGIVEALPGTIYNKAMTDNEVYRQSGKALSDDLQQGRTFVLRLLDLIAPAIEGAKSAHRQLQVELQSLAGPKSKRKFYFGIGYQPKFKRSEQSDLLDDAIRVWIDSGGEQSKPVFDAFKEAAARQLDNPDQYLKDKGITDKDPLKRAEAIKQNQREIRHWLKVIDMAEKLTPQQKEFAQKMIDLFEDAGMVAKEHGYLKSFVDNYVRRIYKFKPWEADAVKGTGGHGFRLRFGPNQQRSYKFMLDAVLDGYQVGVKGVTNSWLSYMEELAQVIGDNTFKKIGFKTTDMSGNALFTTKERTGWAPMKGMYTWEWAGNVVAEKELEGEEVLTINDYGKKFFATNPIEQIPEYWAVYKSEDAAKASKIFLEKDEALAWAKGKGYSRIERRRPMERAELFEKRQVNAPAPLAEMFNKVTAKDQLFFKTPALNYILRWNAGVKTWVLMSSFFHHMAGARSWLFAIHHGWKPENLNLISAYKRGLDKIGERDPLLMFLIKNGLMLGVEGEYQERILQGQKGITEALVSKLGLDKAQNVIEGIKRKRENWTNSLFKSFFSGLTAEAACIEYTHELNRLNNLYNLGKLSEAPNPDLVAERVARLINYDFGGLPYQRMGRNPTMQKLARLALLAPDWTESNFRIVTGMIPGLNNAINKLIGDLPEVPGMEKMSRQFFARSMVRIAIMTILAQMLLNGSDDSEEFIEEQMLSNRWNRFRWTELEITKLYNMLGIDTEEQRKTFSIGGHFFDPLKLVDPFKLAKGKGSPLTRVIEAVASGSDWAEKPYTGVKELVTTGKTTKKSYHQPLESGLDRLPSVVVNQIVNMQPIQLGHLIKFMQGEEDALSALMSSAGAAIHTAWAPRMETPIAPSKTGNDTALETIKELQSNGSLKAAPPSRYVSINSKSYQMSPKQYKDFFEKSSDMARPKLEKLVESESFKKLTEEKKSEIIDRIISNARRKARLKVKRDMLQQIREGTLKEAA